MEKNFIGLNESQENLLWLLAEGNNQYEIAHLVGRTPTTIWAAFQVIRETLDAKTNEQAVAIFFRDLCLHGHLTCSSKSEVTQHGSK